MLIWRGKGILVAIIFIASIMITHSVVTAMLGKGYDKLHSWPDAVSMFIAAAAVWFSGKYYNKNAERILFDPTTGEKVIVSSSHTFFWIKMEYWSFLLLFSGIAALVRGL